MGGALGDVKSTFGGYLVGHIVRELKGGPVPKSQFYGPPPIPLKLKLAGALSLEVSGLSPQAQAERFGMSRDTLQNFYVKFSGWSVSGCRLARRTSATSSAPARRRCQTSRRGRRRRAR